MRQRPANVVRAAEAVLAARGLELSPLQRRVIEIVCASHRPVGVEEIVSLLAVERDSCGERVCEDSVAAMLSLMSEAGLAHCIHSLGAYAVGGRVPHAGRSAFMLCERCGTAREIEDASLVRALSKATRRSGFTTSRACVELHGVCALCAAADVT